MHYVRLLRAPKLVHLRRATQISLVLAVTTDLGDSLLHPEEAIELMASAVVTSSSGTSTHKLASSGKLQWRPGDRVAKPILDLPPAVVAALASGDRVELCVGPAPPFSADALRDILASSTEHASGGGDKGLVMPVWVVLREHEAEDDLCTRKLRLNGPLEPPDYLELEEELGESIARHIWDASPVVLAAIAAIFRSPSYEPGQQPCMDALERMFGASKTINILELGCGVGILGAGLAAVFPPAAGDCTILMTDLADAENRARTNVGLVERNQSGRANLLYENLDWEDGRHGRFGPLLQRRRWDLVMLSDCTYNTDTLPALVATLSAVHAHSVGQAGGEAFSTKVFLATKQRHSSEQVAWDLLARDGWKRLAAQTLPLPVLGRESQSIDMYLFEKK
ncbi:lysine methyltransferase [Hirsutella rhossiliensis]|uniref:Lysine methyltransferase domain-containing protein n=1 Tax=Hirsutella rhossiliensis TaxID=111463 RepID=A0A9P8SGX0_9HYPO|nr:lysine methyltransferase domain-containing protein [Hirsutella rhossiliensis]KAH0961534.1 lysine methyltransferase domain-containing protein [Hirsutella rhossiliensis]